MNLSKYNKSDIMGIVFSSTCLIHCIAAPVILSFGIGFLSHPYLIYLFLLASFFSVYFATKESKSPISLLLWIGFIGFLLATILKLPSGLSELIEYSFATVIITGHALNLYTCKRHNNKN